MNNLKPLKLVLTSLAIIGAAVLLVMLSIAMIHYAADSQNYTEKFLPNILIPFIITFLVTLILSVFAYLVPGKQEYNA